jgi:cyclopropane fatty-acyl-phospholipid synthase-like methyltransferase
MLHYGYFDDINVHHDTLSLKEVENAQIRYAENIINQIVSKDLPILDVGCGMGGLGAMLYERGYTQLELLTPNRNQIEFINKTYPHFVTHRCKFENYAGEEKKFGTVINSESLQYIKLDDAFDKVDKILLPDGRWIIVDYFRLHMDGISKSAHMLEDFRAKVDAANWKIVYEQDITLNVLPMLNTLICM